MVETLDQRIDRFKLYFENHLSDISRIDCNHNTIHYQRILYMAVLDSLSKRIYPSEKNKSRMKKLLSDFSEWKYINHISLPHLLRILNLVQDSAFTQLRQYAIIEQNKWIDGELVILDHDPTYIDICNKWPCNYKYQFPTLPGTKRQLHLEELKHVNLFYNHRCNLIHEFKAMGKLASDPEPDCISHEPYYGVLLEFKSKQEKSITSWELEYPLTFYKEITSKCLENAINYLHLNQIDPIQPQGSFWIDILND